MLHKLENNIYYDLYNHLESLNLVAYEGVVMLKHKTKSETYIKNKLRELKNPSVLIINHTPNETNERISRFSQHYKKTPYYKLDMENENKNMLSLKDRIIFNGEEYILDSIILSNWNNTKKIPSHSIAGITCDNERYVYNGWTRHTNDPALIYGNINTKHNGQNLMQQKIPCELFKHHWKQDKDSDFCISTSACKLEKAYAKDFPKNLCFSFSKGSRTLIYIKKNVTVNLDHLNLSHTPDYRSYRQALSNTSAKSNKNIPYVRKLKPIKECEPGKIRNPLTGRCIKIENAQKKKLVKPNKALNNDIKSFAKKVLKECGPGKIRDPLTGRCIKIENAQKKKLVKPSKPIKADKPIVKRVLKECEPGKIRNPLTGRCIKIRGLTPFNI
jgi:hypothetical protein